MNFDAVCREEFREWTEVEKAEKIIRVVEGLEGEVSLLNRFIKSRLNS